MKEDVCKLWPPFSSYPGLPLLEPCRPWVRRVVLGWKPRQVRRDPLAQGITLLQTYLDPLTGCFSTWVVFWEEEGDWFSIEGKLGVLSYLVLESRSCLEFCFQNEVTTGFCSSMWLPLVHGQVLYDLHFFFPLLVMTTSGLHGNSCFCAVHPTTRF